MSNHEINMHLNLFLYHMSRIKKKKPRTCKAHPRLHARGRCEKCGRWICADCAYMQGGQLFCKDTCLPRAAMSVEENVLVETISDEQRAREEQCDSKRQTPRPRAILVFWAGLTAALFGLVGILFGVRQMQENRVLRERIVSLQHDRNRALSLLRSQKQRIEELRAFVDSLDTAGEPNKKRAVSPPRALQPYLPTPSRINPETGLPLGVNNGNAHKRMVALTFDGGAYANAAEDILDTLGSRNVKVTMFLTGKFIKRYPALVKRFVGEGHEVGNHTFSHPHLTMWEKNRTHATRPGVTEAFLARELDLANRAFVRITGRTMPSLWRAPYGEINDELCRWAQKHGYLHIGWRQGRRWWENLDSNDWIPDENTPGYHSPEEVYEKVTRLARLEPHGINGGIVLLHLGTERKDPSTQVHRILGKIIDDLRAAGYVFATVSTLLGESDINVGILAAQRDVQSTSSRAASASGVKLALPESD